MCTKWSNLEDWFIATIPVSLLAVWTVKSFLVQPCKHFDLVQIKQLKTETRIVRLQKVTVISLPSATSPSLKATFQTSPYPLWEKMSIHMRFSCCTEINAKQRLHPFLFSYFALF